MFKVFKTNFSFNVSLIFSLIILSSALMFDSKKVFADENSGRLALVVQNNSLDIVVSDLNTGEAFPIEFPGSNDSDEIHPSLSRDGKMIAFSTNNNDLFPNDDSFNILVFMLEGSSAGSFYPITTMQWNGIEKDEFHPTWDPNGGKIAYSAYNIDGKWNDHKWSGETDIYYRDFYETISWYDGAEETDFERWNTESPGQVSLTVIEDGISNWEPSWSHESADSIAYTSDRDERSQIYLLLGIGIEGDDPGLGGIEEIRVSNHLTANSDNNVNPELAVFNRDYGEFELNCNQDSPLIFYSTNGVLDNRMNGEGGQKLVAACISGDDDNFIFGNWLSGDDNGDYNGWHPKLLPGSNSLAFFTDDQASIFIKTGPSGDNNRVWSDTVMEGFSWSNSSEELDLGREEEDDPDVSVNVFGGSVELDTGELFGSGEDRNQQEFDRIDREIELEIRRLEAYKADAANSVAMEERRIEFEREQFYGQIEMQKMDVEFVYQQRTEGWGDEATEDFERAEEMDREQLERNMGMQMKEVENNLLRHDEDFEREKKNLEEQHAFGLAQWQIQYDSDTERIKFDRDVWLAEFNIRKERELEDMTRWYDQELDREILEIQDEINFRIANGEGIEDLIQHREFRKQDFEFEKQEEINNHAADKERELKDVQMNWEFEDSSRLETLNRDIENDKFGKEREMEEFLYYWNSQREDRVRDVQNRKREYESSLQQLEDRWESNKRGFENNKQMELESAKYDYDNTMQQIQMEIERAEMEWEAELERARSNVQRSVEDFDFKIDQMIQEGEMRKQMVAMDQQQIVEEYSAKQDTLMSRRDQIENDYATSIEDANRDYENRIQEVENRRQYCMDEGCDPEEIKEIIALETQIELDYQEDLGRAESNYNREYSKWEFEMRNVSDVIEMGQREDLYEDGDRGFFSNPIVGSIKTGESDWEERMRDPGFLAIAGLVVTVGATVLQMVRGN